MRAAAIRRSQGDRELSVIELQQVTYTYPGANRPALDGVTLEVEPGELVVLAGASGSGKSTLLRTISGLVPHFHGGCFEGRVMVTGMDTREHGPGQLAAAVGTLFQDPETQIVMGTVRSELAFPLENRGHPAAAVARGVEEAALALGIGHLLDRPTGELSGGELQRAALGAALAARPPVLVLDEPTSQLDPVAGDELMGVLRRLNEDLDVAILICEHRLERCLPFADRVIALDSGRVVCDARPPEFLTWAIANAPELATPGARLLSRLGLRPVAGVKAARSALRQADLVDRMRHIGDLGRPRQSNDPAALRFDRVWHEISRGPTILRGVSLTVAPRDRVALMGRNGAGKSTLLRHAAGLMRPTRGNVQAAGRVALLLQNPSDYLVHDTVSAEAPTQALATVGLAADLAGRHPRDLSGGEKQRLALAIVLGDPPAPVVCLDEPTRGMDRGLKEQLALLIKRLSAAVVVATHDPEFAAAFADRVILLGDGVVLADGSPEEILTGGTYFATETSRIVDGALTPEHGVAMLSWETAVR
jgi:energy-coupling factor transport system ATP-binding protein